MQLQLQVIAIRPVIQLQVINYCPPLIVVWRIIFERQRTDRKRTYDIISIYGVYLYIYSLIFSFVQIVAIWFYKLIDTHCLPTRSTTELSSLYLLTEHIRVCIASKTMTRQFILFTQYLSRLLLPSLLLRLQGRLSPTKEFFQIATECFIKMRTEYRWTNAWNLSCR